MVDHSASTPVERLCRLYDDRMTETGGDLSPEDLRELKAMAAIYARAQRDPVSASLIARIRKVE